MNIDTKTQMLQGTTPNVSSSQKNQTSDEQVKFSDELKNLSSTKKDTSTKETEDVKKDNTQNDENNLETSVDELQDAVDEINKLNRTEENSEDNLKNELTVDDNKIKREDLGLIDNNMNIQEPKDKINLQMGSNTNFSGNGQPFAEFVNAQGNTLKTSANDLAEEKAVLSTMEENIAIANKNIALEQTQTVSNESGIKRVNKQNITVDTIVDYNTVIMDKADVDFFAKLVNEGMVDLNEVRNASKSSSVSKTLADLIAKSMQDNKPIRINFDNDISVIIKINKNGKISADFLPSSQIAEAYLRENLPLLRQRFDDNNIDYEELNQRKQQQDNNENRKKGRKDE